MGMSTPTTASADTTDQAVDQDRSGRGASVLPFVFLAGSLLLGFLIDATPESARLFGVEGPQCPSTYLLDAGCPGCGLTRGTALLLDGEFASATRVQPAAWLVVVLAALGSLVHGYVLIRGRQSEYTDGLLRIGRALFLTGLLAVWLARLA